MKSSEIREIFLKYFEARGHTILPGSSLVPSDPSVLLTIAGMLQFKPIFLGQEKPSHARATTVQKCIRLNDLENVGRTARHHTFFEMLGNFSFGDYFKKEAIQYAWELLTKELKIPVEKLKIAVYEKDDEAFLIWQEGIGLPKEIIYRLGEDNNFWAAGPTGPCGPCSEIYFDQGEKYGCGKKECGPGCDCDRVLEIWNLVFIQYNRNEKGELTPLKQKGIDTGMGLERITAVLQGVQDNFDTDIFANIIKKIRVLSKNAADITAIKVIADHSRAIVHLIADGVYPGNTGRGYVLRRLIRRSSVFGRRLGITDAFISDVSNEVIDSMKGIYPALVDKQKLITGTIKEEERGFLLTIDHGIKALEGLIEKFKGEGTLPGNEAFLLHDTFGFPIELTVELAEEKGIKVDIVGFGVEMDKQKERARKQGIGSGQKNELPTEGEALKKPTNFTGYEKFSEETKVSVIIPDKKLVVLEKTPFYGESGGQIGDTGIISWDGKEIIVCDTYISKTGIIFHEVDNIEGLHEKEKVKATIDQSKRKLIEAHHTATHLLHKALREVIGEHVKQSGSYVGAEKLRFDFNNSQALSDCDLQQVENIVNQKIAEKIKVEILQKSYPEAVKMGAMALFGEKYGEKVRVIKIGDYSMELCGGTHVKNTSDIAFFKIISEGALGSGIRRIEAVAGQAAKIFIMYQAKTLFTNMESQVSKYQKLAIEKEALGGIISSSGNIFEIEITELDRISKAVDNHDVKSINQFMEHLNGREEWLSERIIKTEKEIQDLKINKAKDGLQGLVSEVKEINGNKVLLKELESYDMETLRTISNDLQGTLKSCILVLVSISPQKVSFLITITDDLVQKGISAKKISEVFSGIIGGKGGGKDSKVEGGGKDMAKVKEGFAAIEQSLK
ncbi:MAG: alanine--tRNA ligase [Candidatus Margulisiibacteriota bacterium]